MQDFIYKPCDDGTFCVVSYQGDEEHVVIPETYGDAAVTVLGDGLFSGHKELRSVQIPDTVVSMGEFIFDGCENLRTLQLPSQLESLWGYTFVRSGLEKITLPDKLVTVPPFAFKDCKNLKRVVCGKGLKKIYSWAFGGCDSLTDVVHEDTTEISPHAFEAKELNT